jgi:hypothetical protein
MVEQWACDDDETRDVATPKGGQKFVVVLDRYAPIGIPLRAEHIAVGEYARSSQGISFDRDHA